MKVFRVRRKSDGLFCNGGEYCHFGRIGKIWTAPGLKMHLGTEPDLEHKGCEIVGYDMVEAGISLLEQWHAKAKEDQRKREAKENKRIAAEQMRVFGETF